jgi:hypothetical protein
MSTRSPKDTCREVSGKIQSVRQSFRSQTDISEVLNELWGLQDELHLLVEHSTDSRSESLAALEAECPRLISDVVDLLSFIGKTGFGKVAAIRLSCAAINNLLVELAQIKVGLEASAAPRPDLLVSL